MSRRYCLTLDLADDPELIAEYRRYHESENVWGEIKASLADSGILDSEIYLLGTRLVMVLEVTDQFSFERKAEMDRNNPKVQEWEELMWKFQRRLMHAKPGEKWLLMERIFKFNASTL